MKKITAMLVAVVMCASVMTVIGSADFSPGITSQLPSGATGEFAWLSGFTSTYCHKTAPGTDLTTFQGNREEAGVSVRAATFIDMHEWNTLCIYWLGDSYGTAGRKFNGFAINDCGDKNQSDSHSTVMTAEKVLKTFEIYTNKTVGTDTWNSWEKIGINDVEYKWDSDSNAGYWLMWFDREVTTDALLVHFEPGSDAVAADMSKVATHGNYLGGLYDSNGVHPAPVIDDEPSTDTGDMLNIAIAVASVAILGTAAAIVMKKRKED